MLLLVAYTARCQPGFAEGVYPLKIPLGGFHVAVVGFLWYSGTGGVFSGLVMI